MIAHYFTIDVEEYFQVSAFAGAVSPESWGGFDSRIEVNVRQLVDLLARHQARATFFVLGWVADRHRDLVRALARAGHEVASHGWDHKRVTEQTPEEFRVSVRRTKQLLEELSGQPCLGFRAPSFSIVPGREWALDILLEEGYEYDSSLFPVRRPGYGYAGGGRDPYWVVRPAGRLAELPPATLRRLGVNLPAAGGAYLRILPYALVRSAIAAYDRRGVPATFYVHPWEIDPRSPPSRCPGWPRSGTTLACAARSRAWSDSSRSFASPRSRTASRRPPWRPGSDPGDLSGVRRDRFDVVRELPRAGMRRASEILLVRSGIAALARRWRRAQTVVLAYHNVLPDRAAAVGDGSLHLSRRALVAQLDQLQHTHDVVPLDAVLDPPAARPHRPRAALTFDDAYQGAITVGLAEVVAHGMPATVFVAPQFVDGGTFWWDALADPPGGEVPPAVRAQAVEALAGDDTAVRAWARAAGLRVAEVPAWARVASEEQLQAIGRLPGITFGAHSWGHPNLTRVAAPRLQEELRRPLQWLRDRFAQAIDWLAYPYGCWSPAVAEAAAAAGYRAANSLAISRMNSSSPS